MKDWFIKTRRLDVVCFWLQASDEYVEFYIEHMSLVYGAMTFGDMTIEPVEFNGLGARYER